MARLLPERSETSLYNFSRLPLELQVMILRLVFINEPSEYLTYLGNGEAVTSPLDSKREQLKYVRCMNRTFCDAVSPAVFASIHVSASRASLRRAERIANSSLAGYVKEIVYHEGGFADRNPNLKLFLGTLASHRRRQDYPEKLKKVDGKDLYGYYLEEIEEAKRFEEFRGPRMDNILRNLPNLVTFVCLPYHTDWYDSETSAYTLKRVGLAYLPEEHSDFSYRIVDFLKTARTYKVGALNLSLFPSLALGQLMSQDYHANSVCSGGERNAALTSLRTWFQKLQYLKIGNDNSLKYGQPTIDVHAWNSHVDLLLQACDCLSSLELAHSFATQSRDPLLPLGCLPNLRTLTLSAGTLTSKQLKDCLLSVSASLRYLHFRIISLVSEPSSEAKRKYEDSIVQLLYELDPNMGLQSCTGLETVMCCKTECRGFGITLGPKPGKEVMVRKVQEAVCHQRAWPDFGGATKRVCALQSTSMETAFFCSHWDEMVDLFERQTET